MNIAIVGKPLTGKNGISNRLRDEHGFTVFEGSKIIAEAAEELESGPIRTRGHYESFFRTMQRRDGIDWIARKILEKPAEHRGYNGIRNLQEAATWTSKGGGWIVRAECGVETALSRANLFEPKHPRNVEEYERHVALDQSDDEYGNQILDVLRLATYAIDTNGTMADTHAQVDEMVGIFSKQILTSS